jgi:hypothetical protein
MASKSRSTNTEDLRLAKAADAVDLDELLQDDLRRRRIRLHDLINLVGRHSWWVSPRVYRGIHVVYPKTRRKTGKERRGDVDEKGNMLWTNEPVRRAFLMAVGIPSDKIRNLTVCHIYGEGVRHSKHFTNLANLTGFPKALSSCSEWAPVQAMLKYRSFLLYGYTGLSNEAPPKPEYYPKDTLWQYPKDLNPQALRKTVHDLRWQATHRPQFRNRK